MKYEKKETLTNIIFPVIGVVAFILFGSGVFSFGMVTLGVGSHWYHKHKTSPIYAFDWFGMQMAQTVCIATLIDQSYWIWLLIAITIYGMFVMGRFNVTVETAIFTIPLIVISALTNGILPTTIFTALFGLALFIRTLDRGVDQEEFHDSWGHAIWHILTGIIFFLVAFYQEAANYYLYIGKH